MGKIYSERVELHCHSCYSIQEGTQSVKDIVGFATEQGMPAVAITDYGNLYAYPQLQDISKEVGSIKPIYGMTAYVVDDLHVSFENTSDSNYVNYIKTNQSFHTSILLKENAGVSILYQVVTDSKLIYFQNEPRIPFSQLLENRKHFLLGSGCEKGMLGIAILSGKDIEECKRIAKHFDYLEINPTSELIYLISDERYPSIQSIEDLRKFTDTIIAIGKELMIPVVAVSDAHYLRPENEISRRVLRYELGLDPDHTPAELHFRTTNEMMEEFSYLGKKKAYEIVVENSNRIANAIESIFPIKKINLSYHYEGDFERLQEICNQKIIEKYGKEGNNTVVCKRLESELALIREYDRAYYFLYFYDLIHKNHLTPADYSIRGCAGGMLVSYLLDISHVNPLNEEQKLYSEFCIGVQGNKMPDIDLNVASQRYEEVIDSVEGLPEIQEVYREVSYVRPTFQEVEKWIEHYSKEVEVLTEKKRKIVEQDCLGVVLSRTMQPGGIVIVPKGISVTDYTPVDVIWENGKAIKVMHYDYDSIDHIFEKLDILPHPGCTLMSTLYQETGYYPTDEDMLSVLDKIKPTSISELIKVIGIAYSTGTWIDNAEKMLDTKQIDIHTVIGCREDIYEELLKHGISREMAYHLTEKIRKGYISQNRMKENEMSILKKCGLPEWFLETLGKIDYLTTRSQATEVAQQELRLLYYKCHYPDTFYSKTK